MMPRFLASYDLQSVNNPYREFIRQASRNGWSIIIRSDDGRQFGLPNTTLTGSFENRAQAMRAFNQATLDTAAEIRSIVTVTSYIVCEIDGAIFNSDWVRQA